jgi:hypothetical protein
MYVLYRVSTLKVEHRQLTLCIQFIDIMPLFRYINNIKDTQPHYIYKPESCLENDNYKLYFDRTVLTDIHIQHNRPDIIILNKQQKQAYLLDIAVPNSHNITQTYNTKINIVIYEPSAGRRCSRMSAFFKARATKERVPLIKARMNGRCLHASGSYNIFCTKIKLIFFF